MSDDFRKFIGGTQKYPKTPHFPWSPNLQNDDRMLPDTAVFAGKRIVITEKLDGENTGMSRKSCHARSLDSRDHPSRHWVKALHGQIKNDIPEGWEIFGENMFARHSIAYDKLTSFFYVFLIVNDKKMCLSWEDMQEYAELLGIKVVPLIYKGMWDEEKVQGMRVQPAFGIEAEGYVVRNADAFPLSEFANNCSKVVRFNHVQTGEFWMKNWKPNKLA